MHLVKVEDLKDDLRDLINGQIKTLQKVRYKTGELSFKDFLSLKRYYFSFGVIFILNALVTIIGTQMIVNAAMFQTLRKLCLVKVYI